MHKLFYSIDSDWAASNIRMLVGGATKPVGQRYSELDKYDTDHIANPDRLNSGKDAYPAHRCIHGSPGAMFGN